MRERSVYFARCLGPTGNPIGSVKIGCSYGPDLRLRAIGSNQPYTLELITKVPGGMVMEKACHLYLRRHQVSGEFFHENDRVTKFIADAKERGTAFYYFSDSGFDHLPDRAVEAFMDYHGIHIPEVCKYLGVPTKRYEGKLKGKKNTAVIASVALLAQARTHFVNWPGDALRALLGERHFSVAAEQESAA